MTISKENFIKTVYQLSQLPSTDTKLSTIAGILNITKPAATDMAKKLAARNLVHYQKYKPLSLTESGNSLALNVLRKHRLWEAFLHETLKLSLHEIHEEAEHLEHLTSDFLANRIEKFLGHPTTDPHGDPIPAMDGEMATDREQIPISETEEGTDYEVVRLYGNEKEFFDFCSNNQLQIGTAIRVDRQYATNRMTEISIGDKKLILNNLFTDFIYVKRTQQING